MRGSWVPAGPLPIRSAPVGDPRVYLFGEHALLELLRTYDAFLDTRAFEVGGEGIVLDAARAFAPTEGDIDAQRSIAALISGIVEALERAPRGRLPFLRVPGDQDRTLETLLGHLTRSAEIVTHLARAGLRAPVATLSGDRLVFVETASVPQTPVIDYYILRPEVSGEPVWALRSPDSAKPVSLLRHKRDLVFVDHRSNVIAIAGTRGCSCYVGEQGYVCAHAQLRQAIGPE